MSVKPVQILYHGTTLESAELIESQGIIKKNHDKVYLTSDIHVAYEYAKQRTKDLRNNSFQPVICIVDAPEMVKDGFVFEHMLTYAEWTTDNVPSKYILQVAVESEEDLETIVNSIQRCTSEEL